MIEITRKTLWTHLRDTKQNILFLFNANYESRSIASVKLLTSEGIGILGRQNDAHLLCIPLCLHSDGHRDVLADLGDRNRETALHLIKDAGFQHDIWSLKYPPVPNVHSLRAQFAEWLRMYKASWALILDISCMPRALILEMLDVLYALEWSKECGISEVILLYTWAAGYPELGHPVSMGSIRGHFTNQSLDALTSNRRLVTAVSFTSGNGYDASLLCEQLQDKDTKRHWVFLLSRDDPMTALEYMTRNQQLIIDGNAGADSRMFVFTPVDAWRRLKGLLDNMVSSLDKSSAWSCVIAPFGPKPLTVAAFLGVRHIWDMKGRSSPSGLADVLVMSQGFRYSSVYSLEARDTSVYLLDMTS
jgi:hypothetical protein